MAPSAGAKAAIGAACAAKLPNGATLVLNIGTTTEAVARALLQHRGLPAVTNTMNVANILAANAEYQIMLTGGALRRSDGGLVGDLTRDFISQFKPDIAVTGTSALDLDGDLLDFDLAEVTVSRAIIAAARAVYLVADHSKLGRRAPARIGALSEVDAIFTDRALPGPLARLCQDWDCTVHVAGQGAGLGAGLGAGRVGAQLRPIAIFANLQSLAMKAPHLAAKSVEMGFVARCPALPPGVGSFGRIQHVQSDFDRLCPRRWSDGHGIRKHRDSGS